ncbi:MAG: CopD family protein [Pseudomonadota bacterium]
MEPAFIIARFVQYAAASILFGSALLITRSQIEFPGAKALLLGGSVSLAVASFAGLVLQTAMLAGSFAEGVHLETLALVMDTMSFATAAALRGLAGLAATLVLLVLPLSRQVRIWVLACGAVGCVTFAWSGHAAATEGTARMVHLASDAIHALAAAGWIGALIVFVLLAGLAARQAGSAARLAKLLADFSPIGLTLVTLLVVSGLTNSWLLFGYDAAVVVTTTYGKLLVAKLALFAVMFALAAVHRQHLAPALESGARTVGASTTGVVGKLRLSLGAEAIAGMAIFAVVSVIGTLDPFR